MLIGWFSCQSLLDMLNDALINVRQKLIRLQKEQSKNRTLTSGIIRFTAQTPSKGHHNNWVFSRDYADLCAGFNTLCSINRVAFGPIPNDNETEFLYGWVCICSLWKSQDSFRCVQCDENSFKHPELEQARKCKTEAGTRFEKRNSKVLYIANLLNAVIIKCPCLSLGESDNLLSNDTFITLIHTRFFYNVSFQNMCWRGPLCKE